MGETVTILRGYSLFLCSCGLMAFAMAGFTRKARTALTVGGSTAGLIFLLTQFSGNKTVSKVAQTLPAIYMCLFAWRSYLSLGRGADKMYLFYIIGLMSIGSAATTVLLLRANRYL